MKKHHAVFDRTTGELISMEPIPDDVDPIEFFRRQIHDCPECRAARERGETPIIIGPEELAVLAEGRELDDDEVDFDEPETRQMRRQRERMARKRTR
jgi:hypothetical protein